MSTVGIDEAKVTEWFSRSIADASPPLRFELVAGGRSNLTYLVEDAGGRRFALRRPPTSHVLPTAHDMAREHRILTALGPTEVPVPRTYGLCTDESVNGAPFYVMSFEDGHVLRDRAMAERTFDEATRRAIGFHLADGLAALHAVDVDAIGLGDLSRHEGYVARQLRRWTEQFRHTQVDGVDHAALIESVGASLAERIPPQRRTSIVHGDYRLDNVVLDDQGALRAILDWEICTLGDPLADVGLLLVYWEEASDGDRPFGIELVSSAPGFCSREELLARYLAASGPALSGGSGLPDGQGLNGVAFYMALGYWKLACILQGVYARYRAGAGAGDAGSVDEFPRSIGYLAEQAAAILAAVAAPVPAPEPASGAVG